MTFLETAARPIAAAEKRIEFLGVPLDLYDMEETLAIADTAMREHRRVQHVVVNVAKLVNMRRDEDLRRDVTESDVINIDGMGILVGCRLLGYQVSERVAGVDLMDRLLERCEKRGYRPFFFGARQDVLETAIANIRRRYPRLDVAGYRNGYFKPEDEPDIVAEIRNAKADCLFVAISSPIKERFVRRYRDELGVSFLMGVGGSIDVFAGKVKRAPVWMQNAGLEWLYRVMQEPRRMWKRYLVTNSVYGWLLLSRLLSGQARPRR